MLCSGLSSTHSFVTSERCVTYLARMISTDGLEVIVRIQCATDIQLFNSEDESLVQALVNIPDKAANR